MRSDSHINATLRLDFAYALARHLGADDPVELLLGAAATDSRAADPWGAQLRDTVRRALKDGQDRWIQRVGGDDVAVSLARLVAANQAALAPQEARLLQAQTSAPSDGRGDKPVAVATVSRDITQRKRAEAETVALKDALAAELAEMTRLHELSTPSSSRTESQLLTEVLEATMELQGADMGSVRLYNSQTRTLDLVAHRGFGPEYYERFRSVGTDLVVYWANLARGERVVIEDVERDPTMAPVLAKVKSCGFRGAQSTPLLSRRGELVGIVSTHFLAPHRPSEHQLRFSDLYARQVAEMIERRRGDAELQRSEAYLAQGERISHTGSWSVNARTGRVFWSVEHYRIFGLEPGKAIPTLEAVAMIHREDRGAASDAYQRAVRQRAPYDDEFRIVRPDGSVRNVHSIGHPVLDEGGALWEYVGTLVDVTERKIGEDALRKAREDLAHVGRVSAMGELIASIAHEVNQPLAAVVANANACLHWLDASPSNIEEARGAASRIIRDGNRASQVITHIRAFLTRGGRTREPLSVEDVIGDVVETLRGDARSKGVSVEVVPHAPLPRVQGDRVQLQQVLLNLVVNAIEALSSVTGRAREIRIGAEPHEDHELRIYVRDTGPGLEAKDVDRIFDTFYTTKAQGMGMGLSISRSIVESHGGHLWAEPNPGPGETFQFTLPIHPGPH